DVSARITNADLADLLAIAGQKDVRASGDVNATAQITGTVGDPRGSANLTIANGAAYDEKFDRLTANVDFSDQLVRLTNTQLAAGSAHIDLNGAFQHPKNSFDTGTLQFHVASNQMSLDQFNAVKKQAQGLTGTAQINADVAANLKQVNKQSELQLTNVTANIAAQNLQHEGQKLGDLTATAQTAGTTVTYNLNSDFAGSTVRVNGSTQLQKDYPTTASASIANLPIERVLAVAGRKDIKAKGNLNATAEVSGTMDTPQASAQIDLAKAVIYDEPLDRVQGRLTYNNELVTISSLQVNDGPAHIEMSGSFAHPKSDFEQGKLQFRVASNSIDLSRLHIVQQQKPGVAGTLQLTADGAGTLQKLPKGSTAPPVLFSTLNANLSAAGLSVNKKSLGDLTLKASTTGSDLVYNLDSDIGHSQIHGQGQTHLAGDYPTTANITFNNVTYSGLLPLLSTSTTTPIFDASLDGQMDVSGPATKPDAMTGHLTVSKLDLSSVSRTQPGSAAKQVRLQNQDPIVLALSKQVINVQSAHLTGHSTDINLKGDVALTDKNPLNLQLTANTNLKILQDFDKDVYSDGSINLDLAVRGPFTQPLVNGQLRLQNASFNMIDLPNGLSNANGVIQFNGTSAVIQNLKAETGGGTVTAAGGVGFANGILRYGLRANAANVRVRTPEGISVVLGASVNLTGNTDHSLLAGTVTVNKLGFNPHSDFGSILSKSTPPTQTATAPSGPMAGMKLDVRIRTAPDIAVQTALAQNIQADADLTLRGTVSTPGMLGRVNVTSGNLIFFGTNYTINDGSVSFYNPVSIDPILDVDLETKVQGVDVILTVSGPVNDMKLSYRSDPPLQFQEIVALLAA
ncbi:MAG: translocation/assembly module TamB domain-containing protein, partial [Acidobacteriaceae bacterium]|nr:translocation/assembly module TamB domain-containing protein [Acidobacteriaceae bacterium]